MAAPVYSSTRICNMALTRLGESELLTSLDTDTRPPAIILRENYESLREVINADSPWAFATRRATLAVDAGATPNHEFSYAYTLPVDYMALVRTEDDAEGFYSDHRIEGDYLLTNETTVKIEYLYRQPDINKWSNYAREALVTLVMAECGPGIKKRLSANYVQGLISVYEDKIFTARALDAQQGKPRTIVADSYLTARQTTAGVGSKVSDFY